MGALCAGLVAVTLPGASASGQGRPGSDGAQIRRTEYGVPHILAHTYTDLGYGYGYAFAQDNACQMADRVLTLRGQRSAVFGPDTWSNDGLNPSTNLDSDTYFQALRRTGTIAHILAAPAPVGPSAELRQMVDGYTAGFNRYLKDVGVAHLPDPTCQGQPWVRPITAEDVWTNILDINQAPGISALRQLITTAAPPAANPAPATPAPATPATAAPGSAAASATARTPISALAAPLANIQSGRRGSNGWALGAKATAAGDSMVLVNPHLPFIGDARLYQVQLTIPGVLDVTGASLYGTPVVQMGHTQNLAWTHTATDALHMSIYQMQLVPGDPTSYLVDGRPEKMTVRQIPVQVLGADGTTSTVTKTLYNTRYGPVLSAGWSTASALTVRDANADNLRSMDQWLAMDRAQSISALQAAQRRYQGAPWVYTLAADTSGSVYYTDSSVMPHVTDAQLASCTVAPPPGMTLPLLNGSAAACAWGRDTDAVTPGLFGPANQPKLTRRDYVANSNNTPALTNPAAPLTGYPAVYNGRETQLELRPQLGLRMIAGRLAGTDGLGPAGFTLPTLRTLMLDDADRSAQIGLADILALCRTRPTLTASDGSSIDVRAACTALAGWDGHGRVDSHGQVLWGAFFTRLLEYDDRAGSFWRVPYDPHQPLSTPRGIDTGKPLVATALADTVQAAAESELPLNASPGQARRWDGVPLHGCADEEGCFNVMSATPTSGQNGGIDASDANYAEGSTFIMAVEMTPAGPKANTLLTYSESANPASPHYADQSALFSHGRWVTDRFSAADIAASPALQVTNLRR
ncbi:penicillin acylase family protein [Catenulispora yoronensis]|uniref:Penicillin acylase family protein n=1 Tax=Catenulispora yoronensis TaxID=450799 RepID=A0ABP5F534_9ACTN